LLYISCTNPSFYGCFRLGTPDNYINPTTAARIRTVESFSFKYGRVEISAKMPRGDWLWPGTQDDSHQTHRLGQHPYSLYCVSQDQSSSGDVNVPVICQALWMLPRMNAYAGWPTSGEIDICESRGNKDLSMNGVQIGEQQVWFHPTTNNR
jgi:hypothetical protein